MTVGVIFCAYESEDFLSMSLSSWIAAKKEKLGGHEFRICTVACPFAGFPHDPVKPLDGTIPRLRQHLLAGDIDHLITSPHPISETEARGRALRWLVEQEVDYLWQSDADEIYTQDNIVHIMNTVLANPFIAWWRLSLMNAVFNEHTFLADPFTPARLHKVNLNRFRAVGFWDDNNVLYRATDDGTEMRDVDWAAFTIPPVVAFIKHMSWISNLRSRQKVEYQRKHFGHCGYRWDEQRGLCFDELFYAAQGLPLPEVIILDTLS